MELATFRRSAELLDVRRYHPGPSELRIFLTKFTLRTAVGVYKVCSLIKSVPFQLESKGSLRVEKFQSRWKLIAWHLANWLFYFTAIFQFLTFFQTVAMGTTGNAFAVHTIFLMASLFGLVFMLSLYMKPDECILLLFQHDQLLRTIRDLGVEIPPWPSHPFVILSVNYMAYAVASLWFILSCLFPVFSHYPCYLYSYLPATYQTTTVMLICMVYESTWTALSLSVVVAFYCYWCADIFTINSCLTVLLRKRNWTEADIKLYNFLQVFCVTFNDFNGSFFTVGFTFALVALPIVFIYNALTLAGSVHILVFLVFPAITVFNVTLIVAFLPQHSKVRLLSKKLVNVMKQGGKTMVGAGAEVQTDVLGHWSVITREKKIMRRKQIAALRPLGIKIWFFGVYTMTTTEVLMDQMFNNIILLMSL